MSMRNPGRSVCNIAIERGLAHRLRVVSAHRSTTISGLLSEVIEPKLTELERQAIDRYRSSEEPARTRPVE